MKIPTTIYLHWTKDAAYEKGIKLGLEGKALDFFLFACTEVELELLVDTETGEATISKVDGMAIMKYKEVPFDMSKLNG